MERNTLINDEKTQVISIVGAGGKTSLLYTLAEMFLRGDRDLRLFGFEPVQRPGGNAENIGNAENTGNAESTGNAGTPRVLVTTTTKILVPEHCGWCADLSAIRAAWDAGRYAVSGSLFEEDAVQKLRALPEEEFRKALDEADVILIEADGARHLPLKMPADHEPVICPETTHVLGVAGLSCLGAPVSEVCFRWELLPEILLDRVVTEEMVAAILASGHGARKNVGDRPYLAVLNQCTTPERKAAGEKILGLLKEKYQVNGVLTALSAP